MGQLSDAAQDVAQRGAEGQAQKSGPLEVIDNTASALGQSAEMQAATGQGAELQAADDDQQKSGAEAQGAEVQGAAEAEEEKPVTQEDIQAAQQAMEEETGEQEAEEEGAPPGGGGEPPPEEGAGPPGEGEGDGAGGPPADAAGDGGDAGGATPPTPPPPAGGAGAPMGGPAAGMAPQVDAGAAGQAANAMQQGPQPAGGNETQVAELQQLSQELEVQAGQLGQVQVTPGQPMPVSHEGEPVQPSQALLNLAGQDPTSFLESSHAGSPEKQQLDQFTADNDAFVEASANLRTFSEDEYQHMGVDPFKAQPYEISGLNLESVQAVLGKVGEFAGNIADIAGIVGLVCKVAGWVLSVLLPPVGAALTVVGNFLTLVEIIANVVAAVCAGINAGIDLYRLCTTDNPQEQLKFAGRFADNVLTGVGRGAFALATGSFGGLSEGRAALTTVRTSARMVGRGVATGARTAGRGVAAGARTAGRGVASGGRMAGRGAATAGRGLRTGGRQALSGIRRGGAQAGRGVGRGASQAGRGIRQGAGQAGRGARTAGRGVAGGGRTAGRGIGAGGRTAGRGVQQGGRTAGRGIRRGAGQARSGADDALAQGARTAGRGIQRGAGQAGRGIRRGAGQAGRGVRRGAGQAGRGIQRGAGQAAAGARTAGRGVARGGRTAGRGVAQGGRTAGRGVAQGGRTAGRGMASGARQAGRGAQAAGRGVARGAGQAGRGLKAGGGQALRGMRNGWRNLTRTGDVGRQAVQLSRMTALQRFKHVFWSAHFREGAQAVAATSRTGRVAQRLGLLNRARQITGVRRAVYFNVGVYDAVDDLSGWIPPLLEGDVHEAGQQYAQDVDLGTGKDRYLVGGGLMNSGGAGGRNDALKGLAGHLLRDGLREQMHAQLNEGYQTAVAEGQGDVVADNQAALGSVGSSAGTGARDALSSLPQGGGSATSSAGGGGGEGGELAGTVARMGSIGRQMEVYEQQLGELGQEQGDFDAADQRAGALNALPVPESPQPAAPSSIAILEEDIAALETAEADANHAKEVFQANLETHAGRAEDADALLDGARERRTLLEEQQAEAQAEQQRIAEGQQGLADGEAQQQELDGEAKKGESEGAATQAEVDGTTPEPEPPPPEEDVPWYRIDKHVVRAAKAAYRATVGRAIAYIGEKWAALKQHLTQMLMEFALGLAGGDELKQKLAEAGEKATQNEADNVEGQAQMGEADTALADAETQTEEAKTDAEQMAEGYAELVVEAEETAQMARDRKAESEQWRDEMQEYVDGFEAAYGPSFEAAAGAQGQQWGQQNPSPTTEAIDAEMETMQPEYDELDAAVEQEALAIQAEEAEAAGGGGDAEMMQMEVEIEMGPPEPALEMAPMEPEMAPEQVPELESGEAELEEEALDAEVELEGEEEVEVEAEAEAAMAPEEESGELDAETSAWIDQAAATSAQVREAVDTANQQIGEQIEAWNEGLQQEMPGLELDEVVTQAQQLYDQNVGDARALLDEIDNLVTAARGGDQEALAGLAEAGPSLREVLDGVQALADQIVDGVREAYVGAAEEAAQGDANEQAPAEAAAGGG